MSSIACAAFWCSSLMVGWLRTGSIAVRDEGFVSAALKDVFKDVFVVLLLVIRTAFFDGFFVMVSVAGFSTNSSFCCICTATDLAGKEKSARLSPTWTETVKVPSRNPVMKRRGAFTIGGNEKVYTYNVSFIKCQPHNHLLLLLDSNTP